MEAQACKPETEITGCYPPKMLKLQGGGLLLCRGLIQVKGVIPKKRTLTFARPKWGAEANPVRYLSKIVWKIRKSLPT
jgi:hypothetical protein